MLAVASAATAARIKGTRHADRLQTVNRVRDVVSCGAGRDLATVDLLDRVAPDCETVTREISRDPYRNAGSSHETQVEPDTFAAGRSVVAVFQSGRFFDGGATNIGFAVSRNRGVTWRHGFLPGLTQGGGRRASDPAVTYDAGHRVWLAVSLVFGTDSYALAVSRSPDGLHWAAPVTARLVASTGPEALDKEWIGCDNWASSPFRGRCYLTYSDLGTTQIATQVSSDGGRTWGPPVSGPGFPGRQAILGAYAPAPQVAVLRNGTALLPYFDETQISVLRSSDGGASWSGALPVTPARYAPHPGFRAGPISSAEVGADGNAYVAWADCSRRAGCATNDIVFIRSTDGIGWSAPTRIPTGTADAELPGLAADPSRPGRLALAYYTLRGSTLDVGFVSSRNGGARLDEARETELALLPDGLDRPHLAGLDGRRLHLDVVCRWAGSARVRSGDGPRAAPRCTRRCSPPRSPWASQVRTGSAERVPRRPTTRRISAAPARAGSARITPATRTPRVAAIAPSTRLATGRSPRNATPRAP